MKKPALAKKDDELLTDVTKTELLLFHSHPPQTCSSKGNRIKHCWETFRLMWVGRQQKAGLKQVQAFSYKENYIPGLKIYQLVQVSFKIQKN